MSDYYRLTINLTSEQARDLLRIAAAVRGAKEPQIATAIVSKYLEQHRDELIKAVSYLAQKRSISFEQMWLDILQGKYMPMTDEELRSLSQFGG